METAQGARTKIEEGTKTKKGKKTRTKKMSRKGDTRTYTRAVYAKEKLRREREIKARFIRAAVTLGNSWD